MRWVPLGVAIILLAGCGTDTKRYEMTSGSMEPAIKTGEVVTARVVAEGEYRPTRGDVVVFRPPDSWAQKQVSIARVVGLGGETLVCCDLAGRLKVNGSPLDEPYVKDDSPLSAPPSPTVCRSRSFGPVKVEAGQIFLMGDHRLIANDSRCQGPVPADRVIGVVQMTR